MSKSTAVLPRMKASYQTVVIPEMIKRFGLKIPWKCRGWLK